MTLVETMTELKSVALKVESLDGKFLGTIQHLDSGFWAYQRPTGVLGLANTGSEAVQKLGVVL